MKVVILSTATSYTGGAIITLLNVLPLLKKEGVEPYFILKGHGQLEDVLRNSCNDIIEKSYSMGQYYGEVRKIKNENRQRLISTVHWTAEQENEFKQYWKKNYGKEISSAWHKLYQSYTGKFNVRYFPEYLFSSKLEPLFDKNPYNDALEDKNLLHLYTAGGG